MRRDGNVLYKSAKIQRDGGLISLIFSDRPESHVTLLRVSARVIVNEQLFSSGRDSFHVWCYNCFSNFVSFNRFAKREILNLIRELDDINLSHITNTHCDIFSCVKLPCI